MASKQHILLNEWFKNTTPNWLNFTFGQLACELREIMTKYDFLEDSLNNIWPVFNLIDTGSLVEETDALLNGRVIMLRGILFTVCYMPYK